MEFAAVCMLWVLGAMVGAIVGSGRFKGGLFGAFGRGEVMTLSTTARLSDI